MIRAVLLCIAVGAAVAPTAGAEPPAVLSEFASGGAPSVEPRALKT